VAPKYGSALKQGNNEWAASLRKCAAELRSGVLRSGSPDLDKCFDYSPSFPPETTAALIRLDSIPARLATQASTFEQFARSSQIVVNSARNYGSIPIRVLTASDPPPGLSSDDLAERPPFAAEWQRAHDAMAALSTDGINEMVQGSSHYIQDLKPEVVISTVGEVIDKARTNLRTGFAQH